MATERDSFHLRQILRAAAHLDRRLAGLSQSAFVADVDEVDLSAFRLLVIGESSRHLSVTLKARHQQINWRGIVGMRNLIAHDYDGLDPHQVWLAVTKRVPELAEACRQELARSP